MSESFWRARLGGRTQAGGAAAAAAGTRVLSSVLYGVGATDAGIFLGTAALLVVVASVANWIPARRASRIRPVTALRYE